MKTFKSLELAVFILTISLSISCSNSVNFKSVATEELGLSNAENMPPRDSAEDEALDANLYFTIKEEFSQTKDRSKVDILFVDDNSVSMYAEQEEMANKFGSFISSLADTNWQIAVTTTDLSNGPYGMKGALLEIPSTGGHRILNPSFNQPDVLFGSVIKRPETLNCDFNGGTCPSGDEQPLKAMIDAISKRDSANTGFFREDSSLAVVVLSDEDELSTRPSSATKPEDVIKAVKTAWPKGKNFAVYGIIIEPQDQACLDSNNGQGTYGTAVSDLSKLTGGTTGSICAKDYSPLLKKIAESVVKLITSIDLGFSPEPKSIQVDFNPPQNIKWSVSGNRLTFQTPPTWGTKISVTYKYKKEIKEFVGR